MGFRIGNSEVIDNSRNLVVNSGKNIKFSDNTYQLSAPDVGFLKIGPFTAGGTRTLTIKNPNAFGTETADFFGFPVAVSGNRCIVGAVQEDDSGGTSIGKAYIFDVTTGVLLHVLNNPRPNTDDTFGRSVAISGNRCIVGAPGDDFNQTVGQSGAAYIFDVTTGELLFTLDNPTPGSNDEFGASVAIYGKYCAVGVPYEDSLVSDSGVVYIYDVNIGASSVRTINNPNPSNSSGSAFGDFFGNSIAMWGNYIVVGANNEDEGTALESGKVYVFDVATLALTRTITNPSLDRANDSFGRAVDLYDTTCVIGAPFEDTGTTNAGTIYVYDIISGTRIYTVNNPKPTNSDWFGFNVAIGKDVFVSSTIYESGISGSSSGEVYVYSRETGALIYTIANPNAFGTTFQDYFGYSLAVENNYIIASGHYEDSSANNNSGAAYVFAAKDLSLLDMIYTTACSP